MPDPDAMGYMFLDCLEDPDVMEIIEREDGYIDGGLGRLYFADFPGWPRVEQEAIGSLLPGRVLDLGCGAGRAELYLQSKGIEVVGIDNSPGAVEVCRQRGVKDARLLSITQVGPALGVFDNILMLGNNWGLMGSFKRARWLLRRFLAITAPRARIIAATRDVYKTDNPFHLAYQARNRTRGRMSGQIRMRVRYAVYRSGWFDYLMVSQDELRQILEGTGWQLERCIVDPGSLNYAVVIEKAG